MPMLEEHDLVVQKELAKEHPEHWALVIRKLVGIPTTKPIDTLEVRMSKDQFRVGSRGVEDSLVGGGSNRLGVLPNLDSEIDQCDQRGYRRDELADAPQILNRHFRRLTDRR